MGTKSIKLVLGGILCLGLLGVGGAGLYVRSGISPTMDGPERLVRFAKDTPFTPAMNKLSNEQVVRNPRAMAIFARYKGKFLPIKSGTYRVKPGMSADEILASLEKPVQQMVRIPEGWWIDRVAKRLESKNVCTAADYIAMTKEPGRFESVVSFPLPKDSLEGYLYPDTFDLPPLLGAEEVIKRQLRTFDERIYKKLPKGADLHKLVTIASMIELEVAKDFERPLVAKVIENRLKSGMRLQLDATVLYALQEWKNLGPGIVNTVESPYNTYLNDGLPPGPIGSPREASVMAALNPGNTDALFYVAMPDQTHLFARAYGDHLQNINKARRAAAQQRVAQ